MFERERNGMLLQRYFLSIHVWNTVVIRKNIWNIIFQGDSVIFVKYCLCFHLPHEERLDFV